MRKNTRSENDRVPRIDRRSFLWLLLAGLLLPFSNGATLIPIAAWLGPLFLVRFLRTRRALPGLLLGYLVNAAAFYIQWRSAFLDAGAIFGLYSAAFGLLVYLPYVADRLLHPHVRGFASSLILTALFLVKALGGRKAHP